MEKKSYMCILLIGNHISDIRKSNIKDIKCNDVGCVQLIRKQIVEIINSEPTQ